jgi:predicted lipid carrier protein YhbT
MISSHTEGLPMHSNPQRRLPAQIATLLSRLPAYPGACLFVAGLNITLARHLPADVRAMLAEKRLRLNVLDAGLSFDFCWNGRAFAAARHGPDADLTIGASLHDFALLGARKEDPDTLFFARRLLMEGDTELGLLVKNTLDALQQPLFAPAELAPAQVLKRFWARRGWAQPSAR